MLRALPAWHGFSRAHTKQVLKSLDLSNFQENPALAATACLEMVDRHRLAANHKLAPLRLIQPVVKRTYRDAKAASRLLSGHQIGSADVVATSFRFRHIPIFAGRPVSGIRLAGSGRHAPDLSSTGFANRSHDAKPDANLSQPGR
jgi:hypothetical protein